MKLTQIGISNFRSIGAEFVTIDLTKKLNVLVGANNCGKSNVLRALETIANHSHVGALSEVDYHRRSRDRKFTFSLTADVAEFSFGKATPPASIQITCVPDGNDDITVVESSLQNLTWPQFEPIRNKFTGNRYSAIPAESQILHEKKATARNCAHHLWKNFARVSKIPVFRKVGAEDSNSLAGDGAVKLLARWQQPELGHDKDEEKFTRVKALLRSLTENDRIALQIPPAQKEILIVDGPLRLPLESLGTGIHELIILAIAVLQHDNALICIEEPEIHLHPLLQRRFLEFLRSDATTNRYVLTTHSPALIAPGDDVAVTHLWLENGVTKSRRIATTGHSLEALRDLGAKASDLLQANSVIWVEGPSDRIYLNRWLELLHPELKEGIDYAVMFYGGRLLSYLSAERDDSIDDDYTTTPEDTDDLIQLLRINQYSAIVIDSDRRAADAAINATKQRVAAECKKSGIPCWITAGREIENCLPALAVTAAFSAIAGQSLPAVSLPPFAAIETALETAFSAAWPRASYYEKQKPQRARIIARHLTAESVSPEVRIWIDRLARTIRHQPPS